MPIDHYSPCPCGSGKKLKFCKCVENPQDFEKLIKLIEGGQEVAALDRINQMLTKTPNAAWLLALKGELTLGMQEVDSFRETAKRFLKLKPDNPLALIMTSVVSSIDGEPQETAARHLLQGMAESRESLPAMALPAIQMLIRALASTGNLSMVGYWADVYAALTGNETQEESVLLEPGLNLIAKAPAKIIDDPAGVPWKERLAEVLVLARTFRYEQAETKLQSILRDFPGQPGPLSHLLRAKYAQLDQSGAMETARKLAACIELSAEDRAYYAAVAMELEPEQTSLKTQMTVRYCEVDSDDRLTESLSKLEYVEVAEVEGIDQARQYFSYLVHDEVPARRIYNIFDATKGTADNESGKRSIASSVGTVVFFSKQTDKPPRILFLANSYARYSDRIQEVLDALQLGNDMDATPPLSGSYVEFLNRPRRILGDELSGVSAEELGPLVLEEFLNMPFVALENQTPLEATQDEKKRAKLLGILSHFEGEQSIVFDANVIPEIYQRLNLERPRVKVDPASPALKLQSILDLERINIEEVSAQQLRGVMIRGMGLGASRVCYRCAKAIVKSEELQSDPQIQVVATSNLLAMSTSLEEKIELSKQLETLMSAAGTPVGRVIIQRLGLLHAAGRVEEAQKTIMDAVQKYPEDPYLMSFIQYAMQGAGGPVDPLASRMQGARPGTAQTESGLLLPGQTDAPAGESKLWLPGS
jgi:tetratricopeptide (TPR) repeat protein